MGPGAAHSDVFWAFDGRLGRSWMDSPCCPLPFMEHEAVEVVGDVGQREFGFRPHQADRADEQAVAVLLLGKDVLDHRAYRRFAPVRPRRHLRHPLAMRLAPVDPADQPVGVEPRFVLFGTIGAIRPDVRGRVFLRDYRAQHPPVRMGRAGDSTAADKTEPPVDGDVRLLAEHRLNDLRQRHAVRAIADFTPNFEGPTRAGVLLRGFGRLVWPDIRCTLARFDGLPLALRVALFRSGYQGRIHDGAHYLKCDFRVSAE